ncbi:hypothetical protein [Sanyastnella coralliicola]|uniref:hypothetical protein n=1 Tax=Sanyastnella coralliicola TaxID=3069118 RepID=UPI0027B94661|nr:hypothetical protein [Longitalea sp. SCSIO 12813]
MDFVLELCGNKTHNRMTITLNSPAKHQLASSANAATEDKALAKRIFEEVMQKKCEYDTAECIWTDDNTVEITGLSGPAVHRFILELEKNGKDVSFERKMVIRIS